MARQLLEPTLTKFETVGATITGRLIEIESATLSNKPVPKFLLELENGDLTYVLGTEDMKKKVRSCHIGLVLTFTYKGVEKVNGWDMKRFEITAD